MMPEILVTEDVLGCAVRYALGRSTYIVGLVCDQVSKLVLNSTLSHKLAHNILSDIEKTDSLGSHSCDIQAWTSLKLQLVEYIKVLDAFKDIPYLSKENSIKNTMEMFKNCPKCSNSSLVLFTDSSKGSTQLAYIKCEPCNSTYLVGFNNSLI